MEFIELSDPRPEFSAEMAEPRGLTFAEPGENGEFGLDLADPSAGKFEQRLGAMPDLGGARGPNIRGVGDQALRNQPPHHHDFAIPTPNPNIPRSLNNLIPPGVQRRVRSFDLLNLRAHFCAPIVKFGITPVIVAGKGRLCWMQN